MTRPDPSPRPVRVFVAPTGNAFMADIAAWLVEAAELLGRTATLVDDGSLPRGDGAVELVVAPHEFYPLSTHPAEELRRAASVSVPVCTEQPGTPWFRLSLATVRLAPAVLDINPHGVAALRAAGIEAEWLRLGAVPSLDRRQAGDAGAHDREVEVLFLGGETERRGATLAGLAPLLWDRRAEFRLFSAQRPVHPGVPGLVFGTDKYDLLARTRILLNVHRDDPDADAGRTAYFEWARMIEAMANGVCVVTEPSDGAEPLQAGVHFVESEDLPGAVAELLADPERAERIGRAAAEAVLGELALALSLAPHLDRLDRRIAAAATDPDRTTASPAAGRRRWRTRREPVLELAHRPPLLPVFAPAHALRLRTYHALMAEMRLQRRIDRARCLARHGTDDVVERWSSPAHERQVRGGATPRVSVVVTLFNYAGVVAETLESVAASTGVEYELLVVDDHSTDDGRAVVRGFADSHPEVPLLLLGSEINRGLAASRNLGVAESRAPYVFVLDADNLVYPSALRRLADALDADPDAAFAYATLEDFGVATGLRSAMGWYAPWLCDRNYIDAQAMFRRTTFERHGGYRTGDDLVHGWEDWELWLRLAEAGERGVHLPVPLGRYRTQTSSMITTTNLAADAMLAHLRELHPTLPWPG
jgi:hypothetical protein